MERELTLLTDFYELTMMQGYFLENRHEERVIFDYFYRTNPSGSSFSISAGLSQVIDYIKNLKFSEEDIDYLRSTATFTDKFLDYLRTLTFTGDIYAVPEGTVIFPQEPILKVIAPILEAQLIETAVLNLLNHQSLIATKAARIKWAAGNDQVLEFGLRRAQGPDAGVLGARAAIIGGCDATSNVLASKLYDLPVKGTHAHSWVMSFETELEAFKAYARHYTDSLIFLVDTYDTLKSGVPNAIKVFSDLKAQNALPEQYGIRLDSGDLAYLSKKSRHLLDAAGFHDAIISASSDLDEYLITDLKLQGAQISLWGVGTNLITSRDCPAFGGVYKYAGCMHQGIVTPKLKLSENPDKVTNPGNKKIIRIYYKEHHKIQADLIALEHETYDENESLTIFDPINIWKKKILEPNSYTLRELLVPIFIEGQCVYPKLTTQEISTYCQSELHTLWDESRRLINPQNIFVDLSQPLYDLKSQMIKSLTNR